VFLINVNAAVAIATYPIVINNAPIVGTRIAQFINFLRINANQTRLVGHSLGAHICMNQILHIFLYLDLLYKKREQCLRINNKLVQC